MDIFLYGISSKAQYTLKKDSAYQVLIRNKREMTTLLKHMETFPLIGNKKVNA